MLGVCACPFPLYTAIRIGAHSFSADQNAAEEAELCQWLEFAADVANRKNLSDDQAMVYLQFLNEALARRAFVTGPRSTTADTTLFAALRDDLVNFCDACQESDI